MGVKELEQRLFANSNGNYVSQQAQYLYNSQTDYDKFLSDIDEQRKKQQAEYEARQPKILSSFDTQSGASTNYTREQQANALGITKSRRGNTSNAVDSSPTASQVYDQLKNEYIETGVKPELYDLAAEAVKKQAKEDKLIAGGNVVAQLISASKDGKIGDYISDYRDAKNTIYAVDDVDAQVKHNSNLSKLYNNDGTLTELGQKIVKLNDEKPYFYKNYIGASQSQVDTLLSNYGLTEYNLTKDDLESLVKSYEHEQNARNMQSFDQTAANATKNNPLLYNLGAVGGILFEPIATAKDSATHLYNKVTGQNELVDTNDNAHLFTHFRNSARNTTSQMIYDDTGSNLAVNAYQLGTSIADSGVAMAVGGLVGQPASLAIMSSSAFENTLLDAQERGLTQGQAIETATMAGIAEALFEKLSLDNLTALKSTGRKGFVNIAKDILKQMGVEGSEELFTDIGNAIFDQAINGDQSALMTQYNKLIADGMTPEEAEKIVVQEFAKQLGQSFVGGAISGAFFGTLYSGIGNYINNNNYENIGANATSEQIYKAVEQGRNSGNPRLQALAEKVNKGRNSERNLGKLMSGIESLNLQTEMSNSVANEKNAEAINKAIDKIVNTNGESITKADVQAITSSDKALATLNNVLNTTFTKDTLTVDSLKNMSRFINEDLSATAGKKIEKVKEINTARKTIKTKGADLSGINKEIAKGTVTDIKSIYRINDDGSVVALTNDNKVVSLDNVRFDDYNKRAVVDAAIQMDTGSANIVISGYNGENTTAYINSVNTIYDLGQNNITSLEEALRINKDLGGFLSENNATALFNSSRNSIDNTSKKGGVKSVARKGTGKVTVNDDVEISDNVRNIYNALAKKTGLDFVITNDIEANGRYETDNSTIVINANSGMILSTTGHELAEFVKAMNSEGADAVTHKIIEYMYTTNQITKSGLRDSVKAYMNAYNNGDDVTGFEDVQQEMVFNFIGGMLTNEKNAEKFAKWLAGDTTLTQAEKQTVWDKIKSFVEALINDLKSMIGMQSKYGRMETLGKNADIDGLFEEWLTALDKAIENYNALEQKNTTTEGDVRFSLAVDFDEEFDKVVNRDAHYTNNDFVLGKLPQVYTEFGLNSDLYLTITPKHIRDGLKPKKYIQKGERLVNIGGHSLSKSIIKQAVLELESPAFVFTNDRDRLIVVTNVFDKGDINGDNKQPVSFFIEPNGTVTIADNTEITNHSTSIYGRDNAHKFILNAFKHNQMLKVNKKEAIILEQNLGEPFPNTLLNGSFNSNIATFRKKVKSNLDNKYRNAVKSKNMDVARALILEQAKRNGYTLDLWHETNADIITTFDLSRGDNGGTDWETPIGIFTKTSNKNIGLGENQIHLFAKANNTLVVESREHLKALAFDDYDYLHLAAEIERVDKKYSPLSEKLDDQEIDAMEKYFEAHEDERENMSFEDILNAENLKYTDEYAIDWLEKHQECERLGEEWRNEYSKIAVKAKDELTKWLKENGYDSVYLKFDGGSGGRKTDAFIFLNPNQVKSAETVTYDDKGKLIPLSKRFNEYNNDTRFSKTIEEKELTKLTKENAELRQAVTFLKQELKTGHYTSKTQLTNIARDLKKRYNSRIDTVTLVNELNDLFNFIGNDEEVAWESVMERAEGVVKDVIRMRRPNTDLDEYSKDILRTVHGSRIKLDEEQVREAEYFYGSLKALQKELIGRIYIDQTNGVPLDTQWQEWAEILPGTFDADTNANDQPMTLVDIVDSAKNNYIDYTEGLSLEEEAELGAYELWDTYLDTPEKATIANQRDKRINQEREKANARIADLTEQNAQLKEQKQALKNSIAEVRKEAKEKAAKDLNEYKQKVKEQKQSERDRREKSVIRQKIRNVKKALDQKLLNPTDNSYVPEYLVNEVIRVCDLLTDAERRWKNGNSKAESTILRLDTLHRAYMKLQEDTDNDYRSEYDSELAKMIDSLADVIKDKQVSELTLSEMQDVYTIVKAIKNSIIDATKQIGRNEAITNYEARKRAISEVNKSQGVKRSAIGTYEYWSLNAMRLARMFSDYDNDAEIMKQFLALQQGARDKDFAFMVMSKAFNELQNQDAYESFAKDKIATSFVDVDGNDVYMTESQIAQLYMTAKRKQGANHILDGGFVVYDSKLEAKGKKAKAEANAIKVKDVTITDITNAYESLSPYAKQWISAAENLFNSQSKEMINKTSMVLKHRRLANDGYYIPIAVNKYERATEIEALKYDSTIEGNGSLKSVNVNAKQSVVLEGLQQVVDKHIDFVSQYYGLAIPIRNFNKVYGGTLASWDENVENNIYSLREALDKKWTVGNTHIATKTIDNVLTDLASPRKSEKIGFLNPLQSAYVQATLNGKLSVALAQAASYPTAGAVLSKSSLIKGAFSKESWSKNEWQDLIDEIDAHTGIHYKRRLGLSIQEIADLNANGEFIDKIPGLRKIPKNLRPSGWIQAMDCRTTATLWIACKEEISALHPNVQKYSDEYWQMVTDLYCEVIEKTQPNYDVLHRAEIQKTPDANKQWLAMFKTQTLQNAGIVFDAVGEYNANKRKGIDSSNSKKIVWMAVGSQAVAAALFVAMKLLVSALTHKMNPWRDDDDEITAQSVISQYGEQVFKVLVQDIMPIGGGEITDVGISIIKGAINKKKTGEFKTNTYDLVSMPVVSMINDFYKDVDSLITSVANGDDHSKVLSKLGTVALDVSKVLGTPIPGMVDIVKGVYLHGQDIVNGEFLSFESGVDRSRQQNVSRYETYLTNDRAEANRILEQMLLDKKQEYLDQGLTNSEATNKAYASVRSSFSSHYKKEYQRAYLNGDTKRMAEISNILTMTKLWNKSDTSVNELLKKWRKDADEK